MLPAQENKMHSIESHLTSFYLQYHIILAAIFWLNHEQGILGKG